MISSDLNEIETKFKQNCKNKTSNFIIDFLLSYFIFTFDILDENDVLMVYGYLKPLLYPG